MATKKITEDSHLIAQCQMKAGGHAHWLANELGSYRGWLYLMGKPKDSTDFSDMQKRFERSERRLRIFAATGIPPKKQESK